MILRKNIIVIVLVLSFISNVITFFEPFSFTALAVAGVAGLLGTGGKLAFDYGYCKYKECCTPEHFPANFNKLDALLNKKVYGQHLVQEVVVNALRSHWNSPHAQKALTLSFHGWPGGGKNYVSRFIKESLYTKGSSSNYVHHFMGRVHFPLQEMAETYKYQLYNWIKGNVTKCPNQLFIFDEVDKMPPTVLNAIKPMIDYNDNVEKVDYRKCVFIFLSNTGGSIITNQMINLWKSGVQRNNINLRHFEKLIAQGAFNEEGGFHHADAIKSNLIDHYVPFLPLEMEHVKLCILDEFLIRGISNPQDVYLQEVLDFVEWGPSSVNLYSKTGCKRLSQKVAMVVQKYKIR